MSEKVTGKELEALQEIPSALEMGELRKIITLENIPLAEGKSMHELETSHQEANEDQRRKLKMNSLKRFLRLSPKKKSTDGTLEADKNDNDFVQANVPDEVQHSPKESFGSFSKATLKSSFSTYWNSVFKHKKSGKSLKSKNELDPNDDAASDANMADYFTKAGIEVPNNAGNMDEENILAEQIQSLKIS